MTAGEAIAALPERIRVGPFDFAIIKETVHTSSGRREWGSCNTAALEIRIQNEMPVTIKAVDTLLHESLHAIFWAYSIYDEDKEERTVSMVGSALAALHRDNPWLAGWIAAAVKDPS